jgi:hypothetical protein
LLGPHAQSLRPTCQPSVALAIRLRQPIKFGMGCSSAFCAFLRLIRFRFPLAKQCLALRASRLSSESGVSPEHRALLGPHAQSLRPTCLPSVALAIRLRQPIKFGMGCSSAFCAFSRLIRFRFPLAKQCLALRASRLSSESGVSPERRALLGPHAQGLRPTCQSSAALAIRLRQPIKFGMRCSRAFCAFLRLIRFRFPLAKQCLALRASRLSSKSGIRSHTRMTARRTNMRLQNNHLFV